MQRNYIKKNKYSVCFLNDKDVCLDIKTYELLFDAFLLFMENASEVPFYNKKAIYVIIKELTGIENTMILTSFLKKLTKVYYDAKYIYNNEL